MLHAYDLRDEFVLLTFRKFFKFLQHFFSSRVVFSLLHIIIIINGKEEHSHYRNDQLTHTHRLQAMQEKDHGSQTHSPRPLQQRSPTALQLRHQGLLSRLLHASTLMTLPIIPPPSIPLTACSSLLIEFYSLSLLSTLLSSFPLHSFTLKS